MTLRIGLAGTKETSRDFLADFADVGRITHLLTLAPRTAERNEVANYTDLTDAAQAQALTVHRATRYALAPEDIEVIAGWGLDLLFVIGWERILPAAVLDSVRLGTYGMHGSPWGLPRGRGRSPLNWSLILGLPQFSAHLFRYDAGMDSGDVMGTVTFEVNDWDDIESLHFKGRVAMRRLVAEHLPRILTGEATPEPQQGKPTFFPRRRPEDGQIDWRRPAVEVHRLIRAVAPPYPGAFTYLDGRRLNVHASQPLGMPSTGAPGEVVETSAQRLFAVQCGDAALLVRDWAWDDGDPTPPRRGQVLASASSEAILEAIRARYGADVAPDQREV